MFSYWLFCNHMDSNAPQFLPVTPQTATYFSHKEFPKQENQNIYLLQLITHPVISRMSAFRYCLRHKLWELENMLQQEKK